MQLIREEKGMALMLTLLILLVVLTTVAAINKSVATQVKVDAAFPDSQGALTHAEDALNIALTYLHKGTYTVETLPDFNFSTGTGTVAVIVTDRATVGNHSSCTLRADYTEGTNHRTVAVDVDVTQDLKEAYTIPYNDTPKPGEIGPFVQFVKRRYKLNEHNHRLSYAVWGYFNHTGTATTGTTIEIPPGKNEKLGNVKWQNYFFPDGPETVRDPVTLNGRTYTHPSIFEPGDHYNVFVTEWDEDDDNNHAEKWFLYGRMDVANNGTTTDDQYYVQYTVTPSNWRELSN